MVFARVRDDVDLATALVLISYLNMIDGYPSKGVDSGRASGITLTWDGTGPTPAGWTSHQAIEHPTAGTYEVRMTAATVAAIGDLARRALLTEDELTALDAHLAASSEELDSAWTEIIGP